MTTKEGKSLFPITLKDYKKLQKIKENHLHGSNVTIDEIAEAALILGIKNVDKIIEQIKNKKEEK